MQKSSVNQRCLADWLLLCISVSAAVSWVQHILLIMQKCERWQLYMSKHCMFDLKHRQMMRTNALNRKGAA